MASYQKRGKTWTARISYTDQMTGDRKYQTKSGFLRKNQAEEWAISIEQTKFNESIGKATTKETFADYFERWFTTYKLPHVEEQTINHYRYTHGIIKGYFKELRLNLVTREYYQTFLNDFGKNHAIASSRKVAMEIRSCVRDAVADGAIARDFTRRVVVTGHEATDESLKYLDGDDMHKLIDDLSATIDARRSSRAMALLALYTGARFGEIAGLTWDNVDEENGTIDIKRAWNTLDNDGFKSTKNKQSVRNISVNQEVFDFLRQLHRSQDSLDRDNPFNLVFLGQGITPPSSTAANNMLKRTLEHIGAKHITFHGLRHTHASYLIYKGLTLYYVSERLGHANFNVTLRVYSHMIHEMKDEQNKKLLSVLDGFRG